jgi:UDP-N-acetylglucosamine 2-epimerase (non-hydrolysing)
MNHLKIMTIAGARPNFMKVASISEAIKRYNGSQADPLIEHVLVHTGQHYDEKLSQCFFDELGLPRPDINLEVGSASHSVQTANIMKGFEPVLLDIQPDILIVVGDVNSTVACALVAAKSCFPHGNRFGMVRPLIVHVEAGLRSFDRSMPEEINRVLTDALSDVLFVTEEAAIENLQNEGIPRGRIHFVGNVMIDTLRRHLGAARGRLVRERLAINGHYGLVTLHRPSNVDSGEALLPLLECLLEISRDLPLFFPIHPRTRASMQRLGLWGVAESARNFTMLEPLTYLDFLNLLETARLVLTDSGGIQEETTALGVPCVTLRENTERPVTITLGTNYLVGTDPERILTTARDILAGRGKTGRIPPYWDGLAGERVIATLTNVAALGVAGLSLR